MTTFVLSKNLPLSGVNLLEFALNRFGYLSGRFLVKCPRMFELPNTLLAGWLSSR